jgi:hypothetical protein
MPELRLFPLPSTYPQPAEKSINIAAHDNHNFFSRPGLNLVYNGRRSATQGFCPELAHACDPSTAAH